VDMRVSSGRFDHVWKKESHLLNNKEGTTAGESAIYSCMFK
jgi:hypothetical protein